MRHHIVPARSSPVRRSAVAVAAALMLSAAVVVANAAAQQAVPDIPFDTKLDFLRLPPGLTLGEVSGIALNSTRHVFLFVRAGVNTTVHGAAASQLLEFGPDGRFIREIGRGVYGFAFAHTVRIDASDNIWATDEGSSMVIRFNPAGRVTLVLGRRAEAVEPEAPRAPDAPPPRANWGGFNRPTDVAWDLAGNTFIADGYTNSRVVKVDKNGRWTKTWGERGAQPGQFNTLHTIANDAKGNIYVGDRGNRRIQVFDPEGALLRVMTIDVPFDRAPNVMFGGAPLKAGDPIAASGAPWAMCITPGATQYLYVSDALPGRIYKLTLDGKVLGTIGEAGKEPKQFGWIHEIACPSENELFVAELLNWRVQKLTLRPR